MDVESRIEQLEQLVYQLNGRLYQAESIAKKVGYMFLNHTHNDETGEVVRHRGEEDKMRMMLK